jgi:hypothetical protein
MFVHPHPLLILLEGYPLGEMFAAKLLEIASADRPKDLVILNIGDTLPNKLLHHAGPQ